METRLLVPRKVCRKSQPKNKEMKCNVRMESKLKMESAQPNQPRYIHSSNFLKRDAKISQIFNPKFVDISKKFEGIYYNLVSFKY